MADSIAATQEQPVSNNAAIKQAALKFVLLIGVLSFFADFTYEGSRSILGPYLATLQAGALVVSVVTGFGELIGYGLRHRNRNRKTKMAGATALISEEVSCA